jgi:hypothetical protein
MTFIKTIVLIMRLFCDLYDKNEKVIVHEDSKSGLESSKSALIEDFNPLDSGPPEPLPVIYITPPPVTRNEP